MRRTVIAASVAVALLWAAAVAAWATVDTSAQSRVWSAPRVLVDPDVDVDQQEAQAVVASIARDPRGWRTDLDHLTIRIVAPHTTPRLTGLGGRIGEAYEDRGLALITADAWTRVNPDLEAVGGSLDDQRAYVVNHEVGHLLGHDHADDCQPGSDLAPVMRQVSYEIGGCVLNVWPNPL